MTQNDAVKSQGSPAGSRVRPLRPRPVVNEDVAFFWEGVRRGELLIQRCTACGQLRHPPRPMCAACQSVEWETLKSTGRGTIKSFVVVHYPEFPGFTCPYAVATVALDEGTCLVAGMVGVEPGAVSIGMKVQVEFVAVEEDLTLPQFRPVG
ncbi:MAG: DNA-binding protein [Deltaproteobacteria bacterium]|nr:DNA-binding protein [Deltaproteobacteria bacterium]